MLVKSLFNSLVEKFKDYVKYQKTLDELSKLSNRDLKDLGINRADFHRIARKSVNLRNEHYA